MIEIIVYDGATAYEFGWSVPTMIFLEAMTMIFEGFLIGWYARHLGLKEEKVETFIMVTIVANTVTWLIGVLVYVWMLGAYS